MIRGRIAGAAALTALVAAPLSASSAQAATTTAGPVTYATAKATIGKNGTDTVASGCPGETALSGGGAGFATSPDVNDGVEMAGLYPGDDASDLNTLPNDFYAADVAVGAVGSRTVRVTAICVQPSDDPTALTYVSQNGSIGAGNSSSASGVLCGDGEIVAGGFQPDAPDLAEVEVEELGLNFEGDEPMEDRLSTAFSKNDVGFNYTYHAICTTSGLKHPYRARVIFAGRTTIKVKCPAGRHAIGGGYGRFATDLVASEPFDSKDKGKAPDDGWRVRLWSGSGAPQAMYAWASCMGS